MVRESQKDKHERLRRERREVLAMLREQEERIAEETRRRASRRVREREALTQNM